MVASFWAQLTFIDQLLLLGLVTSITYKISWLHRKELTYFSLLQLLYLFVLPPIVMIFLFFFIFKILTQPRISQFLLDDWQLISLIYMSGAISMTGGIIHAIAKMYANKPRFRFMKDHIAEMNRFFHLSFSHNLSFIGIALVVMFLVLLEMSRPPTGTYNLWRSLLRGVVFGITMAIAMYHYTRSKDSYVGYWRDLVWTFVVFGVVGLFLVGLSFQLNFRLLDYQLLFPAILGCFVVLLLSLAVLVKKIFWQQLKS